MNSKSSMSIQGSLRAWSSSRVRIGTARSPYITLGIVHSNGGLTHMAGMGIYVGTSGMSMWASEDGGKTWSRPYGRGLYGESRVFSLTSQPAGGSSVLAGTDQG